MDKRVKRTVILLAVTALLFYFGIIFMGTTGKL